jgi:hypothetical protein
VTPTNAGHFGKQFGKQYDKMGFIQESRLTRGRNGKVAHRILEVHELAVKEGGRVRAALERTAVV